MELSKYLRDYSRTIPGKQQLLIGAYAKALEVIPRQLCDNAGFDATNILNKLRAKHAQVGDTHTHAGLILSNILSEAHLAYRCWESDIASKLYHNISRKFAISIFMNI